MTDLTRLFMPFAPADDWMSCITCSRRLRPGEYHLFEKAVVYCPDCCVMCKEKEPA